MKSARTFTLDIEVLNFLDRFDNQSIYINNLIKENMFISKGSEIDEIEKQKEFLKNSFQEKMKLLERKEDFFVKEKHKEETEEQEKQEDIEKQQKKQEERIEYMKKIVIPTFYELTGEVMDEELFNDYFKKFEDNKINNIQDYCWSYMQKKSMKGGLIKNG